MSRTHKKHRLCFYNSCFCFFIAPLIKTEPLDDFEANRMGFAIPQILSHPYYHHNQRSVQLHPDGSEAPCQRLSSSLPGQDAHFQQQQRPAIVYPRGGRSLSAAPGIYQQAAGVMPDPHCSVLVHTGCPAQPVGPVGGGQHPPIIQFSPTNHHHLLRAGDPQGLAATQPDSHHQLVFCDTYPPQAAEGTHPHHYPTVIQQQPYVQKAQQQAQQQQQQKGRAPANTGSMAAPGDGRRRVTVKEENLDQAYLDDGECKSQHSPLMPMIFFFQCACVV